VNADFNYQSSYLFVYGTLLDDGNEFGVYLKNNSQFFTNGRFKGVLFDLGEYPGAIYRPGDETYVYGSVFILKEPDKVLKMLDTYEGFGENENQPNLFTRELIGVETGNEPAACWVYLYNLPVDNFPEITQGRYSI
jgi:gamma-glutamylcyclotransferase (GGCT)/AIG2-like uncharacterized protein YtfP